MTDKESDMVEINKETKQGDPLSGLLFNTVLQVASRDAFHAGKGKRMGVRLGDYELDCLTNFRSLTMCSCL